MLYVNRLMTDHIVGMDRAESDTLLEDLFQVLEDPSHSYEHVWQPDDLVIWDNRCSIHARTDFPETERRKLRRLTVMDENPVIMGDPPGLTEVAAE